VLFAGAHVLDVNGLVQLDRVFVTGIMTVGIVTLLTFLSLRVCRCGVGVDTRRIRPWFVGHGKLPTRSQESRASLDWRPSEVSPVPDRLGSRERVLGLEPTTATLATWPTRSLSPLRRKAVTPRHLLQLHASCLPRPKPTPTWPM